LSLLIHGSPPGTAGAIRWLVQEDAGLTVLHPEIYGFPFRLPAEYMVKNMVEWVASQTPRLCAVPHQRNILHIFLA